MYSSRKNPSPLRRSSEIPWGRGILKAKTLEAKYKAKLEFLGGRGGGEKQNTFCGGEYGYFLELHNHLTSLHRVPKSFHRLPKCA